MRPMPGWRYDEEGDVIADSDSSQSSSECPEDDSDVSAEIRPMARHHFV